MRPRRSIQKDAEVPGGAQCGRNPRIGSRSKLVRDADLHNRLEGVK